MGFTIPSTDARQTDSPPSASGQTLSEYGLILGLVAIVCVGGLNLLGKNITAELTNYGQSLDGQGNNMAATAQTGSPYSANQYNTTPASSSPMPSPAPPPPPPPAPSPPPSPTPTPAPIPTIAPPPPPSPTPAAPPPPPPPSSQSGGGTPTAVNGCNGCSNSWGW